MIQFLFALREVLVVAFMLGGLLGALLLVGMAHAARADDEVTRAHYPTDEA
jgi:hypothetical protein